MSDRLNALQHPTTDPTSVFELFRGSYATELLTAAVAHFGLFARLADGPLTFDELRGRLGLAERPATVLITALRAMGLLVTLDADVSRSSFSAATGHIRPITLSPLAREHLLPGGTFYVGDYLGLAAESPGVREMVERLRTNAPAGGNSAGDTDPGTSPAAGAAFIYREGIDSAMERESSARHLTLALAGRAKNVAPILAARVPMHDTRLLLDVGGGTGIYSIACLQANPNLRAIIWDRPEVLRVAEEMAAAYGVADRVDLMPGDMFADALPVSSNHGVQPDCILLSNILHDWDVPACRSLIRRCAEALPSDGRLLIHDVFLNDELDGPLPIALYSAALFTLTEGRAYSAAEYRSWLVDAGLRAGEVVPTLIHCGVIVGEK